MCVCVSGRARDRHHRRKEGQGEAAPGFLFDHAFWGRAEGERKTATILVMGHDGPKCAPEYSAHLSNGCEVGQDGKMAYERLTEQRSHLVGVEFGEAVDWKERLAGGVLAKFATTQELILGTVEGVCKKRKVQGKPLTENAQVGEVRPCTEEDRGREGKQWIAPRMDWNKELKDNSTVCDDAPEPVPRSFTVGGKCPESYGDSAGCFGCKAVIRG